MEQTLAYTTVQAATQLAAAGQYDVASSLLGTLEPATRPQEAILLQAKILAQQGHYADAITYWQQVLAVAPEQQEARQGLHVARRLQATERSSFWQRANLYYGLGVLAGFVLLLSVAYMVGHMVGYTQHQHHATTLLSQHSTQLTTYLEAQHNAVQDSQQQSIQAIDQLTQQQGALHTQTLEQFANIVRALESVQQAQYQGHAQTTATLTILQQYIAALSSRIKAEQQARQTADQGHYADVTRVQESLSTLTTLVNAHRQQLAAYLEAQRQALPAHQP